MELLWNWLFAAPAAPPPPPVFKDLPRDMLGLVLEYLPTKDKPRVWEVWKRAKPFQVPLMRAEMRDVVLAINAMPGQEDSFDADRVFALVERMSLCSVSFLLGSTLVLRRRLVRFDVRVVAPMGRLCDWMGLPPDMSQPLPMTDGAKNDVDKALSAYACGFGRLARSSWRNRCAEFMYDRLV